MEYGIRQVTIDDYGAIFDLWNSTEQSRRALNFPEYQVECLEQTDAMLRIAERAGIYYTIHLDEKLNIADFNHLALGDGEINLPGRLRLAQSRNGGYEEEAR